MGKLKIAAGIDAVKARAFARRLSSRSPKLSDLQLTINNNKSSLISTHESKTGGKRTLSVHYLFLDCTDDVLDAIANWYLDRARVTSTKVLRYYIDSHYETSAPVLSRELALCSKGVVYDLNTMMEDINRQYFGGRLDYVRITWMRGVREVTHKRSGILFGSYDARLQLISIHPYLDKESVPRYFLSFVIYHEMLHALLDPKREPGKRHVVHTARFRMLEKRYPQYREVKVWEQQFMRSL
ncbi:MAG: hypothetical protein PHX74_08975 [Candidatus Sumerlaeales bacterium]|nr:hypothetical protein [Candidatus Sumerlaeales bacterium]